MNRREMSINLVTAEELDDKARIWLRFLEKDASEKAGCPINSVRPMVARDLGLSPGTVRNIAESRNKGGVSAWIYERIRTRAIARMEAKINALQTGLEIARQSTLRRDAGAVCELETLISKARRTLEAMEKGQE